MAVEINELIIQGTLSDGSELSAEEIIKIIREEISNEGGGGGSDSQHQETDTRQLVDECVAAVLKELESKLDY